MPPLVPLARPANCSLLTRGSSGLVRSNWRTRDYTRRSVSTYVQVERSTDQRPKVCVVGGGFGGLYTALRLESLIWPRGTKPQVTIIDRNDRFVFKPLLYELINGTAQPWEVAPPLAQLLAPYPIQFIQGQVSSVSLEVPADGDYKPAGRVVLEDGSSVDYDYLVLGMGSGSDPRGVPGVRELAYAFNTYDDAMKVSERLDALRSSGGSCSIMVVGAGYAGVELAGVVAEHMGGVAQLQLVTPARDILEGAPTPARESALRALTAAGVSIVTGAKVLAVKPKGASNGSDAPPPGACTVVLEMGGNGGETVVQESEMDMVMWTAGASAALKAEQLRFKFPFPITPAGTVKTEPTLRVVGHDRVFAVGDIASVQPDASSSGSGSTPPSAQVAFQQADYAGWNIWASINKRALLPFRYQHLGSAMSLGQMNATMVLPLTLPPPLRSGLEATPVGPLLQAFGVRLGGSDVEGGVSVEGPLAALMRRAAYLYRQPTNEHRASVAVSWIQQAATSAAGISQQVLSGLASRK